MAAVLYLRKRKSDKGTVTLPIQLVRNLLAEKQDPKGKLWDFFQSVREIPPEIHDREWLELLAGFVPEGGVPVKEQAAWAKLALRIDRLDPEREGNFTLKTAEVDLVKKRLESENFKHPRQTNICWLGFYVDLCRALKYRPVTDEELWDDDEPAEGNLMPSGLAVPSAVE